MLPAAVSGSCCPTVRPPEAAPGSTAAEPSGFIECSGCPACEEQAASTQPEADSLHQQWRFMYLSYHCICLPHRALCSSHAGCDGSMPGACPLSLEVAWGRPQRCCKFHRYQVSRQHARCPHAVCCDKRMCCAVTSACSAAAVLLAAGRLSASGIAIKPRGQVGPDLERELRAAEGSQQKKVRRTKMYEPSPF